MTRKFTLKTLLAALVVAAAAQAQSSLACAACYGKSDSPLASGMNWGIFSLLGVVLFVLGGIATCGVFFARRAAAVTAARAADAAMESNSKGIIMRDLFAQILGLPVLASEHGQKVDNLIIYVHYLMAVLFVGWILYFAYALIRFRKSANPKADYVGIQGHVSNYIEIAVAFVEVVLLVGFAVPLWAHAVDEFPKDSENPTRIRIIAQQFQWNVFYPGADGKFGNRDAKFVSDSNQWGFDKNDPNVKDDLAPMSNIMHVPVNKPVIIMLTSKDVIHSFKLIAMRVTQDAIPGVPIPLHFKPTKVGVYQINCAQLCGNGHSGMTNGRLYVDTQEDYEAWLAKQAKVTFGGPAGGGFE